MFHVRYHSLADEYFCVRIVAFELNGDIWTIRTEGYGDSRVNDDFYVELVTHSEPFRREGTKDIWTCIALAWDKPRISSSTTTIEGRSSLSHMGKIVDLPPKWGILDWFIRVEGEGK